MICMLSFSVLAFERKAQLADEGLWFSCLLSGKKKKEACGGGVQMGRAGQKREKKKKRKIRHKDLFLSNEGARDLFAVQVEESAVSQR